VSVVLGCAVLCDGYTRILWSNIRGNTRFQSFHEYEALKSAADDTATVPLATVEGAKDG